MANNKLKDIPGYEGFYKASSQGLIWAVPSPERRGRYKGGYFLKPKITNRGYLQLRLSKDGFSKWHFVHRLAASAFLENKSSYPCVNHIDGNPLNNFISNLEWCSYKHNSKHGFINGIKKNPLHGRGRKMRTLTYNQACDLRQRIAAGELSQKEAALKIGLNAATVSKLVRGITYYTR